jgi:hypothetical protein
MAGSEAEERIRAKVEAEFRRRWPDARIVHELVLNQGGVRIDLAAITEDALIVAEIKSERDVLKRLAGQVKASLRVAQGVWVVVADKHAGEVKRLSTWGEEGRIEGLDRWSAPSCAPAPSRAPTSSPAPALKALTMSLTADGIMTSTGNFCPSHATSGKRWRSMRGAPGR